METKTQINFNISGLLLCAGLSGRMGKLKALMIYNGLPFAVVVVKKMLQVCSEVIIVVGHESEKVEEEVKNHIKKDELSRLKLIFNENYKNGMFTSLQCGLRKISSADWILYHFVDQPMIPETFYFEFASRLSSNFNWLQPSISGRLAHPIFFDKGVAQLVLELNGNNSLRDLNNDKRINRQIWECNYSEILSDIDTIEQYNNLTM